MKETIYYHKNSDVVAFERKERLDGFWSEKTYNERGKQLTLKNSNGYSEERTYNEMGNVLTFENSGGYLSEYTYDKMGNVLTRINSNGLFKIKGKEVTEKEFNNFINKKNRPCVGKKVVVDGVEYKLK